MTKVQFIKAANASNYAPWCISDSGVSLCGKLDAEKTHKMSDEHPDRVCKQCLFVSLGYKVEIVRSGQTRRYGPTINTYRVTDVQGGRGKDEVLEFCRTKLYPATMKGEDGHHALRPHVMKFYQRADGVWFYEAGHEYTG